MVIQLLRPTSEIKPRCYEAHQLMASTIKGTLFVLYTLRMLCVRRKTIALFNAEWVINLHWVCMDLQLLHCRVAFEVPNFLVLTGLEAGALDSWLSTGLSSIHRIAAGILESSSLQQGYRMPLWGPRALLPSDAHQHQFASPSKTYLVSLMVKSSLGVLRIPSTWWMVIGAVLFMPAQRNPCSDWLSRFAVCWPVGVCLLYIVFWLVVGFGQFSISLIVFTGWKNVFHK